MFSSDSRGEDSGNKELCSLEEIHLSVRLIENKRLRFAAEQMEWTVESWKKIMWSHLGSSR